MIGVKDEGIARYLGIGVRTVRRRVAALMDLYNVESRFQLGAAVTRSRETGKVR
jgi:DNA-binding NarL/FixJ family response regulator